MAFDKYVTLFKSKNILLFICCLAIVKAVVVIPKYLEPCRRNNFENCALENGKKALPFLLKGDKILGFPSLEPFIIPFVPVSSGVNLQLNLTNVHLHHIGTAELKRVKFNKKKKNGFLQAFFPIISLIADYNMKGKISILPLDGNDTCEITASEVLGTYFFTQEVYFEDNVKYARIISARLVVDQTKPWTFNFHNLFNGDKRLGDHTNQFLNENWDLVFKEFGAAITTSIRNVCTPIIDGIFTKLPYDKILPD